MTWTTKDREGKTVVRTLDTGVKHNPRPSTPRGLRRHENRNSAAKEAAERSWSK